MQRLRDAGEGQGEAEEVPGVRGTVRGHSGVGDLTAPTRPMPATREERQAALTIMEWAHDDPQAEASAPDLVREYRAFCKTPFGSDEALWRQAFDLALDIWKADQDRRKREAF